MSKCIYASGCHDPDKCHFRCAGLGDPIKGLAYPPRPTKPQGETPPKREWLVIEDSRKYSVFAPDEAKAAKGYIPRDVAEKVLCKDLGGNQWFTAEESALLRASTEWRTELPPDTAIEGASYIAENSIQFALWKEVWKAALAVALGAKKEES